MTKRTIDLKPLERSFKIDRNTIDMEARTVEVSFSSEYPVERYFGTEVLDHSPGAADLSRLNAGAAVLINHLDDLHVGVVDSAKMGAEQRGLAVLRFGRSQKAEEAFQDVVDGIRPGVSARYRINELKPETRNGVEIQLATSWMPFEISLASVPADPSVGVGRKDNDESNPCEVIQMEGENVKTEEQRAALTHPQPAPGISSEQRDLEVNKAKDAAIDSERTRISRLLAIGKEFEAEDMAREYVTEGRSVDELRAGILESQSKLKKVEKSPQGALGLSPKERQGYSLVRAIWAMANPGDRKAQEAAAFEFEVSRATADVTGKSPQGILMPTELMTGVGQRTMDKIRGTYSRQLNVTTPTEGPELVATDLLAQDFIELLRNRSVVARNGARILDNLVGDVAIPRQTGGATLFWVAEGVDTTVTEQAFDQVPLTPRTATAATEYTRRLMLQSSLSVEALVRDDLAQTIATGVDLAALYGTGTTQPLGVSGQTGINTEDFGVATKPTWGNLVNMETLVAVGNADVGNLAYITDPTGRGYAKTTLKDTSVAGYIWEGGEINGYGADVSNQVTATDWFFGNWADVLLGFWSGIDILVDPYSNSLSGTIRIVAMQDMDVGIRHPESFTFGQEV